jgi:hypothetical protein
MIGQMFKAEKEKVMLGSQLMARASCFPREDKVETAARYCQCDDQTLMPIRPGYRAGECIPRLP